MLALLLSAFNGWAQEVVIDHVVYRLNDEKTEVIAEGYADGYSSTTEGPHIQTEVTFDGVKYPVTTIGYYAFMNLNLHASIEIPEGIKYLWGFAFWDSPYIQHISFPSTLISLTFDGSQGIASHIESVSVAENNPIYDSRDNCNAVIETATNKAFIVCDLSTLPSSVTSLGTCCLFTKPSDIITIPNHITHTDFTFLCGSINTLNIPASLTSIDAPLTAGHIAQIENVYVDENNPVYFVDGNCIIEKGTNKLVATWPNSTIPSYITGFGRNSLYNYTGIVQYNQEYPSQYNYEGEMLGNVTLQVPVGTIPRYLYQGWNQQGWNCGFTAITDGLQTYYCSGEGDTWFAPHIDVLTAKAGEGVDLSVVLNADRPVVGFQFDLYLPDGVAVTTDDEGYEDIFLSTARTTTRKHELTAQQQANGSWRVLCYSNSNQTFEGNEGEVCTIHVSTSAGLEGNGYPIILRNVITSYLNDNAEVEQSERSELTSYINFFTPEPLPFGDANNDKSVNVTDIATIVSYIMGRIPSKFVFSLADAYPDGKINVSDITATVSIILNGNSQQPAPRRKARSNAEAQVSAGTVTANLEVIPFAIASGEEKEVEVVLNNPDDDFTGLQFDLVLPDGIELVSDDIGYFVDLGSRTTSRKHTIEAALQGDGSIRVMAYSSRNSNFTGSEGDVVKLTLKADNNLKAGVYNIQLKNIVLSQANGNDINQMEPADYEGSILSGLIAENPIIKGDITAEAATVISNSMAESVTSIDLTQAVAVAEDAEFTTANTNTLILAPAATKNVSKNVIAGDVCANLVLSDAAAFATPKAFSATKATVNRTVNANSYATVAVPFALDETQIKAAFGNDATIYAYNEASEVGNVINLTFKTATSAEANVPFLALTSTPQTSLIFDEVEVAKGIPVKTISNVSFCGNYNGQVTLPENDFFIAQNKLYRSTGKSQISGFRAYLTISGTNVKEMYLDIDGQATSISGINEIATTEDIYDLQGRKVLRMDRGVYISSGKKMIK